MDFENENIFWQDEEKYGINLFLGAGFSVLARNYCDETLPCGSDIIKKVKDHFSLNDSGEVSLDKICTSIRKDSRNDLNEYLRELYKVKDYEPLYKNLKKLKLKNIITTNIDDLIEKIFYSDNKLSDAHIEGPLERDDAILLHKIHGSISYPASESFSFTQEEIRNLFIRKNNTFINIVNKLVSKPTLYWGINLSDGNVLDLFLAAKNRFEHCKKWILVHETTISEDKIEDLRDKGFYIIKGDTKSFLEMIGNRKKDFAISFPINTGEMLKNEFKNNYITNDLIKNSPRRPIKEFFSGAEPMFSDIKSNNIVKTTYYNKALDKIIKFNKVLIVGIPGSGKSTLLMQLACYDDIGGIKLYFKYLRKVDVEKIISIIKNENITVFVDNISTDINAIELLAKNKNIKIVASERLINYETIRNHQLFGVEEIVDVSDLVDNDIKAISRALNRNYLAKNVINANDRISLLEVVFSTYSESTSMATKMKEYISELKKYHDALLKIDLVELFTLVLYVNWCGVPCSMDMLMLYFDDNETFNYNDIYYVISKMKNIIVDKYNYFEFDEQDYYALRSRFFAEKSLKFIEQKTLSLVLNKFLEKVDEHAIVRYDIFKKKYFDADITSVAFNLSAGIEYYEKILANDNNIYIRHQYACFLQRKGELDLAWTQIDQAYTDSCKRVFTISNTHAIIMFEKNIKCKAFNNEDLNIIKRTIKNSFNTLEYCINNDLRVKYHVYTYAKHSIEYYNVYKIDDYSLEYLKFAKEHIFELLNSEKIFIPKFNRRELNEMLNKIHEIYIYNNILWEETKF